MRFILFLNIFFSIFTAVNALPVILKPKLNNAISDAAGNVPTYNEQVIFKAPPSNIHKTAQHNKLDQDFALKFFEGSLFSNLEE